MKRTVALFLRTLGAQISSVKRIKYLALAMGISLGLLGVTGCTKSLPAHVVRGSDGNAYPQAGYTFIDQSKSLDVRWTPGVAYPGYPHVTASSQEGIWNHDSGYTWVSTNADGDMRVVWTAGQAYPGNSHVTSSAQEGEWQHDPGYQWVTTTPGDFRVVWTAGLSNPDYPHITSSAEEGHWHANPGYAWVNSTAGDLRVQWAPGQSDSDHPHILSGQQEGYWNAEPGYSFNNVNDAFGGVVWTPGATHPLFPHIHAADEESYWNADSGYRFISQDSLQVEEAGDGDSSYTDQKIDSALIKGLGALIANAIAQPSENDTANDRFGEAVAGQVRDSLIDSAASDVRDAVNNNSSQ